MRTLDAMIASALVAVGLIVIACVVLWFFIFA
jgi:hypothetical protein